MGLDALIFVFWILSFKQLLHSPHSLSSRGSFSSSLSATMMVSPTCLRFLMFLPVILISACASSCPAFHMMCSVYKLKNQGDNIHPWQYSLLSQFWTSLLFCVWFLTVASLPAYMFLRRLVRWSGILSFKNFQKFAVIHIVKGLSVVNEAEVDFFLNSLAFSKMQCVLAIWSLIPLAFLNPACTSRFPYCWSLAWRILSITLLACEMSAIVWDFEHSLVLPFFGIGMKTDLFQSCGHCWVFQICWHIECSTFTASSFRIWNSSTWIPSPPLAFS